LTSRKASADFTSASIPAGVIRFAAFPSISGKYVAPGSSPE
jgi:hypothetical protein